MTIVDTDIHERADLRELLPYLEPVWHRYITDYGWIPDRFLPYSQPTAGGLDRADAKPDAVGQVERVLQLARIAIDLHCVFPAL